MADINNRSRYTVSVKQRDDLYREYPYNKLAEAKAYCRELVAQGFKPRLAQLDDTFAIRIRQKGHRPLNITARSAQEAEDIVNRIEAERRQGLFIDYTKAHQVSFADLIGRYMKEEGPKHKGWETVEKYKCRGWLEDIQGSLAKRDAQREAERARDGRTKTARGAMREAATNLEWMEKPFALVETTDIEGYIRDRLDVVAPATVDREIDVLSAICNVATNVWKYRVAENPMTGVRRPRYFNERDRRLKSGEEARLLAAAREEDRLRSIELRVEELMADARSEAAQLPSTYAKKRHIQDALARCTLQAETDSTHVPLYEAFVCFQTMTAARRGESLGLVWDDIDLDERSAYLPETKNGRPRKLPLRADLLAVLEMLPRDDARVFPLGADALKKAWARIVARAGLEDVHIHDLRHEGISRVAETGKFSLVDLQAFSGHRDMRMLLRYAHLCTKQLANRLDEAFATQGQGPTTTVHHGRQRLRTGHGLNLAAIVADAPDNMKSVAPSAPNAGASAQVIPFPSRR